MALYSEEWITIFVHGTFAVRHHLAPTTAFKIISDNIGNSSYFQHVLSLRNEDHFFKNHAMQPLGLLPITNRARHNAIGAWLIKDMYDKVQQVYYPSRKTEYYTFGWTGLVSNTARFCEAQAFYHQLNHLCNEYKKTKRCIPRIQIVAYSHGGNVALNLARIDSLLPVHQRLPVAIDELILLGVPMQRDTSQYASSALFKRVINIYSQKDYIQKIDPTVVGNLFSNRRIKRSIYEDHANVVQQVQLKVCVPHNSTSKRERFIDISPTHYEFWFFGWPRHTYAMYRYTFPLYPLPLVVLTPSIIKVLDEQIASGISPTKRYPNSVMTLFPHNGQAHIRRRHNFSTKQVVPWISPKQLSTLQEYAFSYYPREIEEFDERRYARERLDEIRVAKQIECQARVSRTDLCSIVVNANLESQRQNLQSADIPPLDYCVSCGAET